tara:strand:+ start:503 stop:703 length:201 start_codon:yes stop_codon:yes gene_type:complete
MVVVLSIVAFCCLVFTGAGCFVLLDWNRRENRKLLLEQAQSNQASWEEFEARHKESFERSYIDQSV